MIINTGAQDNKYWGAPFVMRMHYAFQNRWLFNNNNNNNNNEYWGAPRCDADALCLPENQDDDDNDDDDEEDHPMERTGRALRSAPRARWKMRNPRSHRSSASSHRSSASTEVPQRCGTREATEVLAACSVPSLRSLSLWSALRSAPLRSPERARAAGANNSSTLQLL